MKPLEPPHHCFDLDDLAGQTLALAERGSTAPNPMVGALIVGPSGAVLGQGWHRAAGQPHAEVEALRDAASSGWDVRGATMIVSLEPCNHHGRTPPCTEAILAAGIAHVHVALRDPNPLAAGGIERLRQAGLRVTLAREPVQAAAARLNEVFLRWVRTRRPFVIGRSVTIVDGLGGAHVGSSVALRSAAARAHAARTSALAAAIVVGAGALRAGVASVGRVTGEAARRPALVILDHRGRLPPTATVFGGAPGVRTIVATTDAAPDAHREALIERGVEVLALPTADDGRIDLAALLAALAQREITTVVVDGGASTHRAFLEGGHVHRIITYILPVQGGVADTAAEALWRRATPGALDVQLTETTTTRLEPELLLTGLIHGAQKHEPRWSPTGPKRGALEESCSHAQGHEQDITTPRDPSFLEEQCTMFESIENAIQHFRRGGMLVVVDDEDRENEGDLCVAASHTTPGIVTFMARQGCGLICVALEGERVDALRFQPMVPPEDNRTPHGTAFTVSIEAARGVTTGISAHDRSHTIQLLASPSATAADFVQPGHVFPLRARSGGVLARAGHTEAGVDLARLAGLPPAATICEIMNEDGTMMRLTALREFARRHDLPLISIADLVAYRRAEQAQLARAAVTCSAETVLPSARGTFRVRTYVDVDGKEHMALIMGAVASGHGPALTRIHSECLTGDVFASLRCDCGSQLHAAMSRIADEKRGVILYLRQEGRGIGLSAKLRAYALQDEGLDTVEANHQLGFPADARDYTVASAILSDLGVKEVKLMTNNPAKVDALAGAGIAVVERIPLQCAPTPENLRYLVTKRAKLGHNLALEVWTNG